MITERYPQILIAYGIIDHLELTKQTRLRILRERMSSLKKA